MDLHKFPLAPKRSYTPGLASASTPAGSCQRRVDHTNPENAPATAETENNLNETKHLCVLPLYMDS